MPKNAASMVLMGTDGQGQAPGRKAEFMILRKLWFIGSMTLILAGLLLSGSGAGASAGVNGYSVSADSYTIGSLTVDPSTANIGDTVTIKGTGMLANAALEVGIGGIIEPDVYTRLMGTATADAQGNWTFTSTVPSTVIRDSDKAEVPIMYGTWTVLGVAVGPDTGIYGTTGDLTVIEYIPASTTQNTTQYAAATLPKTGIPPEAPWLVGAGLLAAAALGLDRRLARAKRV